jgi:hypothetical protein
VTRQSDDAGIGQCQTQSQRKGGRRRHRELPGANAQTGFGCETGAPGTSTEPAMTRSLPRSSLPPFLMAGSGQRRSSAGVTSRTFVTAEPSEHPAGASQAFRLRATAP